uniref:Uncharacterized protein n=1 Tax=Arundo donax TaxID=35708 RepID=A0A0A9EU33_ARUDO
MYSPALALALLIESKSLARSRR